MAGACLLVTGASGLLGRALAEKEPLVGLPRGPGEGLRWDPAAGRVQDDGRAIGAVVHLAGEGIADKRWTEERKAALRDSRVRGTKTLVDWLVARPQRPEVLISASGVGYYGETGDRLVTEDAPAGSGFLAELSRDWEAAARAAEAAGIRVVLLRLGVVLSRQGGALEKMRLPFSLGLGGPVGSGKQWFPWVHIDDAVGFIRWALREPSARGPYNVVAPGIVRQADFARAFGKALKRPAVLPVPAFALKLGFGELADEALLASNRVAPDRLQKAGFRFAYPELAPALADVA